MSTVARKKVEARNHVCLCQKARQVKSNMKDLIAVCCITWNKLAEASTVHLLFADKQDA